MNENRWKGLRRIKIRLIDIILAVLVILAFLIVTASVRDAEAGQQEQTEKAEQHEVKLPIAGATQAVSESLQPLETAEENITETEQAAGEKEAETFYTQIPLSRKIQGYFATYSEEYGCPLAFAIATADVESEFTTDAVGQAGEVGLMQIYPGKDRQYFTEIEAETGIDPATTRGNIAAGCYLLGKYINDYGGDFERASMAYNFGEARAKELWEQGVYSSEYSRKVYAAYEKWDAVIKANE